MSKKAYDQIEKIYNLIDKAKAVLEQAEEDLAKVVPSDSGLDYHHLGLAYTNAEDFLEELEDYKDDLDQDEK